MPVFDRGIKFILISNTTGMVLDYNSIKQVVDQFDHAIIFSADEYRNQAENGRQVKSGQISIPFHTKKVQNRVFNYS